MSGQPWTVEELGILRQCYPYQRTGECLRLLSGRTYKAVLAMAARLGLRKQPGTKRRCDIADGFFSSPDPLSAYWAGFLAADGYISGYTVCLSIHTQDYGHIKKFRDRVAPRRDLTVSGNRVTLTLCSPQMCEDLARIYGIVPRKSFVLPPPSIDDEDCVVSYLAGLLDGDGSVLDRWLVFLGTYPLMAWAKAWFDRWSPRGHAARVYSRPGCYRYRVGIGRAEFFVQRARKLGLPTLGRKWSRIRRPVDRWSRQNTIAARPRQLEALGLRGRGLTYQAIADRLGFAHRHSARSAVLRAQEYAHVFV